MHKEHGTSRGSKPVRIGDLCMGLISRLHRGSEFVSHFFQSLSQLLQMELHFTSGYHPEGDGQMECLNQVLEQYLQAYTNYQQDDWSSLLPLAEFAYNNATNEMTGVSLL